MLAAYSHVLVPELLRTISYLLPSSVDFDANSQTLELKSIVAVNKKLEFVEIAHP
jgi:hypothetical protein